jgi:methionyl-tRNA synthetase
VIPDGGEPGEHEAWLAGEVDQRLKAIAEHYDAMEFRKAAAETRALWAAGNEYLTRAEPWSHFKTDKDKAAVGVRTGINLASCPQSSPSRSFRTAAKTILDAVGVAEDQRAWPTGSGADLLDALPRGHAFTVPEVLFAKIEDDQVADWTERFAGRRCG